MLRAHAGEVGRDEGRRQKIAIPAVATGSATVSPLPGPHDVREGITQVCGRGLGLEV